MNGILIRVLCGASLLLNILLTVKILLLRRSAVEIRVGFSERLKQDTNTLLSISSRDSAMCALAGAINEQLRLLRQERLRYQQGDRELKDAVISISHDLRTPLTAIFGYLDLLERMEVSPAKAMDVPLVRRYLAQIRNRTDAMKALTEELFRYSIVTSVQELKPEPTNIVSVLETCLLSFYALMREKGIEPVLTLPKTPVMRILDPNALNRIFTNIISNALKYSDGDLTISMSADASISFSNTASALDPVAVERLFDRFFTVETNQNSSGLGLSIARSLTEQMGGSIQADYQNNRLTIQICFA